MNDRVELACRWPQFALQMSVDGAVLEVPTDTELATLARAAAQPNSVLSETRSHFVSWMSGRTPDEIEHHHTARVHRNRDLTTRPGWTLDLAVVVDGIGVGMQSVSGFDSWPRRRIVGTTSWLVSTCQRSGLGTRCRAAVIELAFAHLGAESARSWVLADNIASVAVSTKLGYHLAETRSVTENGRLLTELVYELSADDWFGSSARRRYATAITGATRVAELLDE